MKEAMYGIRPICIGMIAAVIIRRCQSNYAGSFLGFVSWQAVVIGAVSLLEAYRKHKYLFRFR